MQNSKFKQILAQFVLEFLSWGLPQSTFFFYHDEVKEIPEGHWVSVKFERSG